MSEITSPGETESLMDFLDRIHAEQQARGYVPRSAEEVHEQLRQMYEEWDEHDREIEGIQDLSQLNSLLPVCRAVK